MIFCVINIMSKEVAIYSIDSQLNNTKKIALTFDDGPHGTLTPLLLDVMKSKNAKVTFFAMGIKVAKHPLILKRAMAEGHEIANHIWDHKVLSKIPIESVYEQLQKTNTAIKKILNIEPKIMRPPYGNSNARLNNLIQNKGNLSVVMWSLDTDDWKRPKADVLIDYTMSKVASGDIILCHDIHPTTIKAMPLFIDTLQKAGFTLVTVSELIASAKKINNNFINNKVRKRKRMEDVAAMAVTSGAKST